METGEASKRSLMLVNITRNVSVYSNYGNYMVYGG